MMDRVSALFYNLPTISILKLARNLKSLVPKGAKSIFVTMKKKLSLFLIFSVRGIWVRNVFWDLLTDLHVFGLEMFLMKLN